MIVFFHKCPCCGHLSNFYGEEGQNGVVNNIPVEHGELTNKPPNNLFSKSGANEEGSANIDFDNNKKDSNNQKITTAEEHKPKKENDNYLNEEKLEMEPDLVEDRIFHKSFQERDEHKFSPETLGSVVEENINKKPEEEHAFKTNPFQQEDKIREEFSDTTEFIPEPLNEVSIPKDNEQGIKDLSEENLDNLPPNDISTTKHSSKERDVNSIFQKFFKKIIKEEKTKQLKEEDEFMNNDILPEENMENRLPLSSIRERKHSVINNDKHLNTEI